MFTKWARKYLYHLKWMMNWTHLWLKLILICNSIWKVITLTIQSGGGGVSLYIRDEISFATRNDIGYFDSEMESIFIEINKDVFRTNSNIVIGLIYRMPDSSVDVFNERISDILNIRYFIVLVIWLLISLNMTFISPLRQFYTLYMPIMYSLL